MGAAKGSGFGCDRRGTIVFAAMDTDDQIPGYNPTPVQADGSGSNGKLEMDSKRPSCGLLKRP